MSSENYIECFVLNFNGRNTILQTIESLLNSEDVKVSITVIDDHSSDDSIQLVRQHYPYIAIFEMPENTKKVSLLRQKALDLARSKYIFITDNDLLYDKRCLAEMLDIISADKSVATCTPRMMHWDQPEKIYVAGTRVHFIGAAIADQRDEIYREENKLPSPNSGSGILLLKLDYAKKVGGFDTNLLQGWGNDGEFYQRLLKAGYKCLYIPTAYALHENKLNVTDRKFRATGQTFNRWVFILSHYSITLIILLIPVFIVYEIVQSGFLIINGLFKEYCKGNMLVLKNLGYIFRKRKQVQALKVVSDKEVLYSGTIYVAPILMKNKFIHFMVSVFSTLLNIYWGLIKYIIP